MNMFIGHRSQESSGGQPQTGTTGTNGNPKRGQNTQRRNDLSAMRRTRTTDQRRIRIHKQNNINDFDQAFSHPTPPAAFTGAPDCQNQSTVEILVNP